MNPASTVRMGEKMHVGCLALILVFLFAALIPFLFVHLISAALIKLGLSPDLALVAVLGIFMGGLINLPIKRIKRRQSVQVMPVDMFGFRLFFPQMVRERAFTIIAVNVGGCLIPGLIAAYEIVRLVQQGVFPIICVSVAVTLSTILCYKLARPMPGIGIAMNPFLPAVLAAVCGLIAGGDAAPAIAFTAGVLGPLIGADLLHLKDIQNTGAGVVSIGGAGTFDGIVISGLAAVLLA